MDKNQYQITITQGILAFLSFCGGLLCGLFIELGNIFLSITGGSFFFLFYFLLKRFTRYHSFRATYKRYSKMKVSSYSFICFSIPSACISFLSAFCVGILLDDKSFLSIPLIFMNLLCYYAKIHSEILTLGKQSNWEQAISEYVEEQESISDAEEEVFAVGDMVFVRPEVLKRKSMNLAPRFFQLEFAANTKFPVRIQGFEVLKNGRRHYFVQDYITNDVYAGFMGADLEAVPFEFQKKWKDTLSKAKNIAKGKGKVIEKDM